MRHSNFAKAFAIAQLALALGIAPATKASDDKGCSVASLNGTFADKDNGFIIPSPTAAPVPFAGVNVLTFDGNGNMTGTGYGNLGGGPGKQTIKGTYTVNPDCTGTYTDTITLPGTPGELTAHAFFVIDDSLNELQIIVIDAGTVVTCVARRQFPLGGWRQ